MTDTEANQASGYLSAAQDLVASNADIRHPKKVEWKPQADITAYELALCLPMLTSQILWYPEDYIPKGCERHFKVT